jgi:hypothetical protein
MRAVLTRFVPVAAFGLAAALVAVALVVVVLFEVVAFFAMFDTV